MPQMAPISWLMLFFIFSSTLILFAIINYFYLIPTPPSSSQTSPTSISFPWKW
uniref:ATP synthase complex subunit 8 n=1 Tax=Ocellarnaca sp. TaxID=2844944 RepID=A0A8F1NHZ8_9ORTH|nr:ATP synthase F0 subunit 8 [Ocellarnaca sp.]